MYKCVLHLTFLLAVSSKHVDKPNIIFLLADDLGWNDVGWHNPDILTPNLDRLAYNGVILDQAYVEPICSPSRTALMTGKYPFTLGMQHGAIKKDKPQGVPLSETLLPQALRQLGYATHIIGKWHLGFCKWEYTPTYRGFDTFLGYYLGGQNYYTHRSEDKSYTGYDFRFNTKVYYPHKKRYSSVEFAKRAEAVIEHHTNGQPFFIYLPFQSVHIPLQLPRRYERMYKHVIDRDRRRFSGMVTAMDDAVGRIIAALEDSGQLNNTLIIFTSDNGGAPKQGGSNWPLRGAKSTVWEGGTRVPTMVWGSMLQKRGYVNQGMMHMTDWFATILDAAGIGKNENSVLSLQEDIFPHLDGVSQWDMIRNNYPSSRDEFVYAMNEISGRAAIRWKQYKLIEGDAGSYRDWYSPAFYKGRNMNFIKQSRRRKYTLRRHFNSTQLYDIENDPVEFKDLAKAMPELVHFLRRKLDHYRQKLVPAHNPRKIRKADPANWGGVWSPGWC